MITTTSTTTAREAKIEEATTVEAVEAKKGDYGFAGCRERFRKELLHNEDWLASVVRCSGKGKNVLNDLPRADARLPPKRGK